MIADAVDHDRADSVRDVREAILDREDNAVVQRIALGRAVEPHGHDRARFFDFQQFGWLRGSGAGGVSHGIYYVLCRIVISYNEFWQESIGLCVNSAKERSDDAIQLPSLIYGLLRGACHRARVRATRWLAMTEKPILTTPDAPRSRRGRGILRRRRRTGFAS